MAELPKRCLWAAQQITSCFDLSSSMVHEFLKNRTNLSQFLELLNPSGLQRIVVFYQARTTGGPIELFFGDPQEYAVQSGTKCCYFLRNCDATVTIDPDVENDTSLTAGVLVDRAWEELHRSLTAMFLPVLQTRTGWGDADTSETRQFLEECQKRRCSVICEGDVGSAWEWCQIKLHTSCDVPATLNQLKTTVVDGARLKNILEIRN